MAARALGEKSVKGVCSISTSFQQQQLLVQIEKDDKSRFFGMIDCGAFTVASKRPRTQRLSVHKMVRPTRVDLQFLRPIIWTGSASKNAIKGYRARDYNR